VTFKGSAQADQPSYLDDAILIASSDQSAAATGRANGNVPALATDGDIAAMTGRIKAAVDFGEGRACWSADAMTVPIPRGWRN